MPGESKSGNVARTADGLLEALLAFNERAGELVKYDITADPLTARAWDDLWLAAGRLSYALERYDGRGRDGIEPRTADPRAIPTAERLP